MSALDRSFRHHGRRIAFDVHGEGERTLVLVHGLLMNRWMYDGLAPELASRGFQVVTVDLLGHGASDRPHDMRAYSITAFAEQLAALLDHLELEAPVVGGTSLGANVSLEMASRHPGRARGLFIEMPVLENGLLAAGLIFLPILVGLRFGKPLIGGFATLTNRIPRSHFLLDILLDWARRDPESSRAVLEGVLFGRTAPTREERAQIEVPALVIGHRADPLHPFSDSDMLVEELPGARLVNAESIFEWRLNPGRLDDELAAFLEQTFAAPAPARDELGEARSARG